MGEIGQEKFEMFFDLSESEVRILGEMIEQYSADYAFEAQNAAFRGFRYRLVWNNEQELLLICFKQDDDKYKFTATKIKGGYVADKLFDNLREYIAYMVTSVKNNKRKFVTPAPQELKDALQGLLANKPIVDNKPIDSSELYVVNQDETDKVVFVKETKNQAPLSHPGVMATYKVYRADSAKSAHDFLNKNPVNVKMFFIVVETPEGSFGRDIEGIYREK